jgi:hypothetical protein
MKNSEFYERDALDTLRGEESASMVPFLYSPGQWSHHHASTLFIPCSVAPDPTLLAYHFFSVALYAIWIMFCEDPQPSVKANGHPYDNAISNGEKSSTARWGLLYYPCLIIKAIRVVRVQRSKLFFLIA